MFRSLRKLSETRKECRKNKDVTSEDCKKDSKFQKKLIEKVRVQSKKAIKNRMRKQMRMMKKGKDGKRGDKDGKRGDKDGKRGGNERRASDGKKDSAGP